MSDAAAKLATAFDGERRIASGPQIEVAMALKAAVAAGAEGPLLAFDDATGEVIDFDLRGSRAEIAARLAAAQGEPDGAARPRPSQPRRRRARSDAFAAPLGMAVGPIGRGLGGAAPAGRPGAPRPTAPSSQTRAAQDAAYKFMSAMAGDLPGFEEASRALYAKDRARFERHIVGWPDDVRRYATTLAEAALA